MFIFECEVVFLMEGRWPCFCTFRISRSMTCPQDRTLHPSKTSLLASVDRHYLVPLICDADPLVVAFIMSGAAGGARRVLTAKVGPKK